MMTKIHFANSSGVVARPRYMCRFRPFTFCLLFAGVSLMQWNDMRRLQFTEPEKDNRDNTIERQTRAKAIFDSEHNSQGKETLQTSDLFGAAFGSLYSQVIESASMVDRDTHRKNIEIEQSQSSWKRHPFNVTQWANKTSGGLDNEDRALLGELYFNASSIFEFGLGESTYIAAETNVPRYAGVDSDPGWVAMAREGATARPTLNQASWTAKEQARKGAHFRFYFADIGPTRRWGYPKQIKSGDTIHKHLRRRVNAFNYQFTSLQVEQEPFDFYMVDGRYRVACALLSFLHGMKHGGDMAQIQVAIHDRNCKGRGYEALLNVADIVHESKRLWVLRLKSNTTEHDLLALWEEHMFNKA